MREFGMGQSIPRFEDVRLLRGRGRYTDDIRLPGQAHLFVLRSPHAFARIRNIDSKAALEVPGVLAVLTGEDALADGLGTFSSRVTRHRPDGSPNFVPPYRVLASGCARHIGDPVAAVVAESPHAAKDAAELVEVDYEPLPSVTDTAAAVAEDAPPVWDEVPDNVCFLYELGDAAAVEDAFARAAHVARVDFMVSRVSANPMEPRTALGVWDDVEQRYTLYAAVQTPHQHRIELANNILRIPANRLRVVSPEVGGAFGLKGSPTPEQGLVLWAARKLGRPIKWTCERSEALISDHHARDNVSTAELALDADGRFLALRVRTIANLGAYLAHNGTHTPTNNVGGVAGVYTTPQIHVSVTGAFSNTSPTAPYRGAGRPEATYAIERVIDVAAAETGIDRVELRRRNLIPPTAMPYRTPLTFTYDSGEFERNMDMALELSDWAGFAQRRAEAEARGRLRGLGIANAIEIAGGPPGVPFEEGAEIRFDATGSVTLLLGSHSHGQGHETAFRQLAAELLSLPPDMVRVAYGDTDQVYHGKGTFGSRSVSVGGAALVRAAEKVIEKGKLIAAHLLEAAERDIEFDAGSFRVVGTDRSIPLTELAAKSFSPPLLPQGMEPGLGYSAVVVPPGPTYPNACHVCEVGIDPDTGRTVVVGYWVVDDVGRVVNPLLLKGQVHGGVAQGVGQVLLEQLVYEADSGQVLTGSFMDYCMPRADDLPMIEMANNEVPAQTNPLGIKGAGEAGTIGALPATVNAIVDALSVYGVRHLDMPATPERVWRAIQEAKAARRS